MEDGPDYCAGLVVAFDDDDDEESSALSLVDLPETLRELIMNYLSAPYHTSSDLLALSATCHLLFQDVERISSNALQNIVSSNKNVDDDWLVRFGLKEADSNDSKRLKTESLSKNQRIVIQTAFQTPIYSLSTNAGVLSLELHPDGKQLLSAGFGRCWESSSLCLWDLSTKQCIRSFKGSNIYSYENFCFFATDNTIVSYSNDESHHGFERLRIWNKDNGACRAAYRIGDDGSNMRVINQEIFVTGATSYPKAIRKVDIKSGEMTQIIYDGIQNFPRLFPLLGEYFAAVSKNGIGEGDILIIDSKNLQLVSKITGPYDGLASNKNGEVVACTQSGKCDLFYQIDGTLMFSKSFVVGNLFSPYSDHTILLLHKSRMYIPNPDHDKGSIDVYNVDTGKIERKLRYPVEVGGIRYYAECMVATENQLIVGFNLGYGRDRAGHTIKAYAL